MSPHFAPDQVAFYLGDPHAAFRRLRADDPGLYLFLEDESGAPQALPSERMLSILGGCKIPPLIVLILIGGLAALRGDE